MCRRGSFRVYDRNKSSLIKRQFYNARLPRGVFPLRDIIAVCSRLPAITAVYYHVVVRSSAAFRDMRKQFRAATCSLRHDRSVTQSPIQKEQHLRHVCSGLPHDGIIFANGRSRTSTSPQSWTLASRDGSPRKYMYNS